MHKPTFEQLLGLFEIVIACLLLAYPSAKGLDALYVVYGISITPQYFAFVLLFGGIAFLILRRLEPMPFVLLFLPTLFYSATMIPAAFSTHDAGPLGPGYTVGFCILVLATHRRQVLTRRVRALLGLKD